MSSTPQSREEEREPVEEGLGHDLTGGAPSLADIARQSATAPAQRRERQIDGGPPPVQLPRAEMTTGTLPDGAVWGIVGAVVVLALILRFALDVNAFVLAVGGVIVATLATYVISRSVENGRRATDRSVTVLVSSAFALAMVPLVSLLYTVISKGVTRFDVNFFTVSMRGVIGEGGGAYHAIIGTALVTVIATVISVPIGIMAAVYLVEYGHGRLKRALTFFVDVMTGIPSIVAGLFAVALFQAFLGPGVRFGFIGAVALSVLMIPIVVRSTEEMLRIVPNSLREASYALGVPKWRTITKVVLPTSLAGIVTGVMLAIARIVGETAPLLVTTGVLTSVNFNPFDGRMQNLAVFAYNEYSNPGVPPQPFIDRAWTAALTLILIVLVLNMIARLIYRRFGTEISR